MVPVAGMIGFGFGHMLYGGSALLRGESDLRELAVLALVPVVVALIWHALGIRSAPARLWRGELAQSRASFR